MFREIRVTRQPEDGRKRRWYQSDYFDLFVWYIRHPSGEAGRPEFVSMQLCYDRDRRQRTLEWNKVRGFYHHRVVKASDSLADHGAGVAELVAGGDFDADAVLPRFMNDSSGLPPAVRAFVLDALMRYARERTGQHARPAVPRAAGKAAA